MTADERSQFSVGRVERLARIIYERFAPPSGPFGKNSRLWDDAAVNQREVWLLAAAEILYGLDGVSE